MTAVEKIKTDLIDKINSIQDHKFLEALDLLVTSSSDELVDLDKYQIAMLEMSEQDIQNGNVVSHEEVMRKNRQWLSEQ